MKKPLIIAAVAIVVVGAAGVVTFRAMNQPADDAAIALVPQDAYVYGNLFIEPSGSQKRALDELLGKFPQIESTDQAIDRLTELLDRELKTMGLSYAEDIEPWMGDQFSFFLSGGIDPPDGAGLLETTDPEAAQEAIDKLREAEGAEEPQQKSYEGIDYELEDADEEVPVAVGFVDDFLVIGTEDGFKAVVDGSKDSAFEGLKDSEDYQQAFDGLDDESILSVYLDQSRLFELLEDTGELAGEDAAFLNSFPGLRNAGASAFVLAARADGVVFQSSSPMPEDELLAPLGGVYGGTDLIRELPSESWAALGVPQLGEVIVAYIELIEEMPGGAGARAEISRAVQQETGLGLEQDILSWMQDAALFIEGTNFQEMGGGVLVESSDTGATKNALDAIRQRVEAEGVPTTDQARGDFEGFSIQAGMPAPLYALVADRLVITYGDGATDAVTEPDATLGDDETFEQAEDALGGDYELSFFVDLDAVMKVVDFAIGFSGQTDDTYEREVKPWLEPLSFVAAGSRRDDDRIFQTFFVGVGEEESS